MAEKCENVDPFQGLEDKSLQSEQEENKSDAAFRLDGAVLPAPDPECIPDTVKIEMLHHSTDDDGNNLLPGETYELPTRKAQSLVGSARAKSV